MGFSIASILHAVILVLNALAILSERRFLAKYGLAKVDASLTSSGGSGFGADPTFGGGALYGGHGDVNPSPLMSQIGQLLSSVRTLLRWPLIFVNTIAIVFALIFG